MPITPDDFDSQPPAASQPPAVPAAIPSYQPQPALVSPAFPAKRATPGWIKLLVILAIVIFLFSLVWNSVQTREVPSTGVVAIDTAAIDTSTVATAAVETATVATAPTETAVTETMSTPAIRLERGVRRYTSTPFHIRTSPLGPGAGAGVDMLFDSVAVRDGETLVAIDVTSDHDDMILCDHIRLVVDGETTLDSTAGLEGGRQSKFGTVQRIDIFRGEHVVLIARFPELPDDAKTLKFVLSGIDGSQDDWSWDNIELRDIAVVPEV